MGIPQKILCSASKYKKTIIIIFLALVVGIPLTKKNLYEYALKKVNSGDFQGCYDILQFINNEYEDTENVEKFCKAALLYENGKYDDAYYCLNGVEYFNEDSISIDDDVIFDMYLKINDKYKILHNIKDTSTPVYHDAPYVGMSESKIDMTDLGRHYGDIRHNWYNDHGKYYIANLYRYMVDGKLVFFARCVNGWVVSVTDDRDKFTSSSNGNTYKSNNNSPDPFDIEDYDNADDFYYDHRDDFFDYEDAEDYFEKNKK